MCPGVIEQQFFMKNENELINPKTKERYLKLSCFGRGGSSVVNEFRNCRSNEVVAVKTMDKRKQPVTFSSNRFAEEVNVHKPLNHENVVKFLGAFEDNTHVYLLLEPCHLGTLYGIVSHRAMLSMIETRYYVRQLAEGCKYLHDNYVIHRDLKVNNVLINQRMRIKIADFGLAIRLKDNDDFSNDFCGTTNYMAPEVVERENYRFEIDCWALGCITYVLFMGKHPFESSKKETTYDLIKRADFHSLPLDIGLWPSAIKVINQLLRRNSSERLTMDDLLNHEFLTSEPSIPQSLPLSLWRNLPGCSSVALDNVSQREQCALAEIAKYESGEMSSGENAPELVQSQRQHQESNVFLRWCYNCICCK